MKSIFFELMWVEIEISSITLLCGVCCRPPCSNSEINTDFLNNLQTCFDQIYSKPDTLVVLLGDFTNHYDPANLSNISDFGCLYF